MSRSPSPADDMTFADIYFTANTVRSLAVAIREGADRRDDIILRIHRAEFIQQARLLVGLIRDIAPLEGEKERAA